MAFEIALDLAIWIAILLLILARYSSSSSSSSPSLSASSSSSSSTSPSAPGAGPGRARTATAMPSSGTISPTSSRETRFEDFFSWITIAADEPPSVVSQIAQQAERSMGRLLPPAASALEGCPRSRSASRQRRQRPRPHHAKSILKVRDCVDGSVRPDLSDKVLQESLAQAQRRLSEGVMRGLMTADDFDDAGRGRVAIDDFSRTQSGLL